MRGKNELGKVMNLTTADRPCFGGGEGRCRGRAKRLLLYYVLMPDATPNPRLDL